MQSMSTKAISGGSDFLLASTIIGWLFLAELVVSSTSQIENKKYAIHDGLMCWKV